MGSTSGVLLVARGLFGSSGREGKEEEIFSLCEAGKGEVDCLKELLRVEGIDVNKQDVEGQTALHWAVKKMENLMSEKRHRYM